ncbi:MAG: cell division protein FtsA, partial [Deltaproteobacteria bacterium]
MGRKERHLVGLDLGTSKVAAIVGEVMGNGEVEIIGLGVAESQGIRRGAVVNQEAAVESIRKAVEAAELTAGIEIDNAYVSLSGTHIKGFNSRGV